MKQDSTNKVQILALGHAVELGERGKAGGAPSKDSIWGVALVEDNVVSFSGRRTARAFRFKTHNKDQLGKVMALASKKFAGADGKKTRYTNVINRVDSLRDDMTATIINSYNRAVSEGKLNNGDSAA